MTKDNKNLNDENRELNDVNPENTGCRKDRNEAQQTDIDTHNQSGTHGIEPHDAMDVENLARSTPGWKVVLGEVFADKIALFSLIIMIAITSYVFGLTMFLKQSEIVTVDLFSLNQAPND